jgi:hypothetical protein
MLCLFQIYPDPYLGISLLWHHHLSHRGKNWLTEPTATGMMHLSEQAAAAF